MKLTNPFAILLAALVAISSAEAVTIDTVPVASTGNAPDTRYVESQHPNGAGSVAYPFNIGKTEVTNDQYVAFLNAVADTDSYGLYSTDMDSTWGGIVRSGSPDSYSYAVKSPAAGQGPGGSDYSYDDKPVVWVSFGDAARFANWLHNYQPTGPQNGSTTEDGAYTLNGAVTDAALAAMTRNPAARWWLPSEDEWYKAAYYDPLAGTYYDYPTGTNSVPNNNLPSSDTGDSANFRVGDISQQSSFTTGNYSYSMTDAGAYALSESPYGTFDQAGNVDEWNERLFSGAYRGVRGGSFANTSDYLHASNWISANNPSYQDPSIGFRVATFIPEPSALLLGVLGGLGLSLLRRTIR